MNLEMTLQDLLNSKDPATRLIGERTVSALRGNERKAAIDAAGAAVDAAHKSGGSGTHEGAHDVTDEATARAMQDRVLALHRGKANAAAPDDADGRAIQDRAIAAVRAAR